MLEFAAVNAPAYGCLSLYPHTQSSLTIVMYLLGEVDNQEPQLVLLVLSTWSPVIKPLPLS